ncbi:hypothetical protein C475_08661 [Halosimplex carlsbadense 2-9-1]|uniref:Uncharacterized protein n=1 Tax=Halosimplex carlsbadense 2-9-1 TaxID=797114 RepID=M0CWJ5_9EURY|nr:hypothetical protein [Halosimplex carlsbadense]ELZ26993.1 hypothetical protein C475_08661 [Halosimplex carlsbadense 2-9-1]
MPSIPRWLPTDWEFWQAGTLLALAIWLLARASRFWLMSALQSLAWSLHGTVPGVPQASLDQIRPVVNSFATMWLPVALCMFFLGFFTFHAEAERHREADGES